MTNMALRRKPIPAATTMSRLPILLLSLLLVAPLAAAHCGTPDTTCQPAQSVHHYVGGLPAMVGGGLQMVPFEGNLEDCDGDGVPADEDGDYEFGLNGGYFLAGHHDGTFCVDDAVTGMDVYFAIGADADGDGLVTPEFGDPLSAVAQGCASAGFGPGVDNAYYVFVVGRSVNQAAGSPAVCGHIW